MLNNNSNAEKMLSWVDFEGTYAKLINAVKIMFKFMFINVTQAKP